MSAPFVVALDWRPNALHVGFFVAEARGDFAAAGVDVRLSPPAWALAGGAPAGPSPAAQLASGAADLCFAPSESAISFARPRAAAGPGAALVSVAAAAAADASAIVALAGRGLARPRDLDGAGRVYASYGARYEDDIVRAMVRADGGKGDFAVSAPPHGTIFGSLLRGEVDATWVFMPEEGAAAAAQGAALVAWKMADFGVPYGYSPVILARRWAGAPPAAVRAVLAAAAAGYEWAARAPPADVAALVAGTALGRGADAAHLTRSIAALQPSLLESGAGARWGVQRASRWAAFLSFLEERGLVEKGASSDESVAALFTNDALPAAV